MCDGIGLDGYTTTTVTPRASLQSDANNKQFSSQMVMKLYQIVFQTFASLISERQKEPHVVKPVVLVSLASCNPAKSVHCLYLSRTFLYK